MFGRASYGLVIAVPVALATLPAPAGATETRTYTYDARGRLVAAVSTGSVNNNRSTTYCLDKADNRTQVVSDTSGAAASCTTTPTCTLEAIGSTGSDEFSISAQVGKVGSCPMDVTLGYSIQYVSGTGSYTDTGFGGGSVLPSSQNYKAVIIYPTYQSVPPNQQLVITVTFTTSTPGVTISPNVATLTILSSY